MIQQRFTQSGFSLVEALVAIALLLIAIVGPMTVISQSLESAVYAQEQVTASFLAQEGVELVQNIRDDYAMRAEADPSTYDSWQWAVTTGPPANRTPFEICFSSAGCALEIRNNYRVGLANPENCDVASNPCSLYKHSSGRLHFNHDSSGTETPYTRVIKLSKMPPGSASGRVQVISTVTWSTGVFGSGGGEVVNEVFLHDIYE